MRLYDSLPNLFRLAKKVSKQSNYRIKMGAVLVRHSTPIATGYNQVKTNPTFGGEYQLTIHAEASCIMEVRYINLKGTEMFIYRENKKSKLPALARPCNACLVLLENCGIKRIWYTTNSYPYFNVERL